MEVVEGHATAPITTFLEFWVSYHSIYSLGGKYDMSASVGT